MTPFLELRERIAISLLPDIRRAVSAIAHIVEEDPSKRDDWVNQQTAQVCVDQADALIKRLSDNDSAGESR